MNHDAIAKTIDSIARTHFHQLRGRKDPLAAQNSDSADFIETAVWAIRDALEEAYQCGWANAETHHKVHDAYGDGMNAARESKPHTTNPHPAETPAHTDWLNGFSDAGGRIA